MSLRKEIVDTYRLLSDPQTRFVRPDNGQSTGIGANKQETR
jgi:hypothetical protein